MKMYTKYTQNRPFYIPSKGYVPLRRFWLELSDQVQVIMKGIFVFKKKY